MGSWLLKWIESCFFYLFSVDIVSRLPDVHRIDIVKSYIVLLVSLSRRDRYRLLE
jgi:hypothetical protein